MLRVVVSVAVFACLTVPALAADEKPTVRVVLDQKAFAHSASGDAPSRYLAAWIVYGTTRGDTYAALRKQNLARFGDDDYLVELRARAALAQVWVIAQEEGQAKPDPYLDGLVEIETAGFMEEYVVSTFATPGWTVPAAELPKLDLPGFWKWTANHLGDFQSPTYAHVEYTDAPPKPAPPGEGLPDPDQYLPSRAPCSKSMDALKSSMARWQLDSGSLEGKPLAADNRAEFIDLLVRVAAIEPYRSTGVTWVSGKAAGLAYLAGFCAVDLNDYPLAEEYLGYAVELAPRQLGIRLELAQALISEKKFDEAEKAIEPLFESSEDKCQLAHAWRKRGYIRFEQGLLGEAHAAYVRSLDFDPQNPIALSELKLLETEIARHGGDSAPYEPPPPGEQRLSECTAG